MTILRIEHKVPDFDGWRKAFDSDPLHRQASGVRRYRIIRPVDDAHFVSVELEFTYQAEAEAMLTALKKLWGEVEGKVMINPHVRIFNLVESREY
jgi:hypothetical protein